MLLVLAAVLAVGYFFHDQLAIDEATYFLAGALFYALSSMLAIGLFGQARLKGWIGCASRAKLASERKQFLQNQDRSTPTRD